MTPTGPADKMPPPTRVRYSILALLCALAMITYLDRAMYGKAKPYIMAEIGVNADEFFVVLMAFQLAYALFEIPSGWLGDTFGPRSTLLRVVVWWSAFVAITGFTGMKVGGTMVIGFSLLIGVQFLFGMGEAGAFPNISKGLYNWFPAAQRGFAKASVWMSARFMGGLTPVIWVLLVDLGGLSWRHALWLFAGVAVAWCGVFWWWFRNKPSEHSAVNEAERHLIAAGQAEYGGATGVPWRTIYGSRNLWFVCLMYIATNFNWYYLMYYLPGALGDQFPDMKTSDGGLIVLALLGGAPLLIGMFGCYLGGVLSDLYIRRTNDRKWGRRLVGMTGYGLAGAFYLAAAGVQYADMDPKVKFWAYAGCLVMVGFCNDLMMAPAWATCQDIGRRYAATVSGTMNMVGNLLGAVTGILVTGLILKRYPGTEGILTLFMLYAAIYWLGVVMWALIDASKPLVGPDEAT